MIAYGLTIAALPDPLVYGGGGDFGAADGAIVKPLENQAVDTALSDVSRKQRFDIFATHESVAVEQIVNDLPGQVRQTNAGHLWD